MFSFIPIPRRENEGEGGTTLRGLQNRCSTTEFELGFPMIAQRIDQNVGEGDFTPTGLWFGRLEAMHAS